MGKIGQQTSDVSGYSQLSKNSELSLKNELPELRGLFAPGSDQFKRADRLEHLSAAMLDHLKQHKIDSSENARVGDLLRDDAVQKVLTEMPILRHEILNTLRSESTVDPLAMPQMLNNIQRLTYLLIGFDVLFAVVLIFAFTKNVVSRLNVISENSLRLAMRQPLLPALIGDDEIAGLDKLFRQNAAKITEMSRRERAVIDNAVDVICSCNERGVFTQISPSCESAWGYAPEELLGRSFIELVEPALREKTLAVFASAKEQTGVIKYDNQIIRKDGKVIDTVWSCSWSAGEQMLFASAHDITERKELERQKQEFLAMVSHDLRTPLSAVFTYLELVLSGAYGEISAGLNKMTTRMLANVQRLSGMLDEFLYLQKVESDNVLPQLMTADLDSILGSAIELVKEVAASRNIEIVATPLNCQVNADPGRLSHVFLNLLSNAIKFSPEMEAFKFTALAMAAQLRSQWLTLDEVSKPNSKK